MNSELIGNLIARVLWGFILVLQTGKVSPGANDLHFYDGTSMADVINGDLFFEILDPPELRYTYRIRPAKDFGVMLNTSLSFNKARLVPTDPLHSCTEIVNHKEVLGHIALSERGDCSFVAKSLKAQQAGALAIIITESSDHWNENLDNYIEMVADKSEVTVDIPAAFLLGRSGSTIIRTLRSLHRPYAVVNMPLNFTHSSIAKMNQPPWVAWG